jgi:hypothetical protein
MVSRLRLSAVERKEEGDHSTGNLREWTNSWRKRHEERPLISLGISDGSVDGRVRTNR